MKIEKKIGPFLAPCLSQMSSYSSLKESNLVEMEEAHLMPHPSPDQYGKKAGISPCLKK